jgi:23S rRNA pseudouridine1911/1915/1917 synthase
VGGVAGATPPAQWLAGSSVAGQRLDRFLCAEIPQLGRAGARRLIEAGSVRVNGRRAAAGQRLSAGDEVVVAGPPISLVALPDPELALNVCYEDAWLVAVDKPAGVPSHPLRPGERGTIASALLARYPEMANVGYSPREPGIVHRLDTDTSGIMLAARSPQAFAALRAQLGRGEMDKRYLALALGMPAAPARHEAWLSARGARVTLRTEPFATAPRVETELLSAQAFGDHALVELRISLARRHQIRAHLAALGHPIAGDRLYGGSPLPGLSRHFLHASELRLRHPETGLALTLQSPLPDDLRALLVPR